MSGHQNISFGTTERTIQEFLYQLRHTRINLLGFDTEYRPGPSLTGENGAEDITKRQPLIASFALLSGPPGDSTDGHMTGYVFDLREPSVVCSLRALAVIPMKLVGHSLGTDLITMGILGIDFERATFFDTFLAAQYLDTARGYKDLERELQEVYRGTPDPEEAELEASRVKKAYWERRLSLVKVAERLNVKHASSADKGRLQQSFINFSGTAPFSNEQIEYAYEDARVAVELYLRQWQILGFKGCQTYLEQVAFPLVRFLARSQLKGFRVDEERLRRRELAVERDALRLKEHLRVQYGVENSRSHLQKIRAAERLNLLNFIQDRGRPTLAKKSIVKVAHMHPFLGTCLEVTSAESTLSAIRQVGLLRDEHGCVHPRFRQFGSKTARVTHSKPSPFKKSMRPMVVPEAGHGIFELDVASAEVWLIACLADDEGLQAVCGAHDVYLRLGAEIVPYVFEESDRDSILDGAADFVGLKKKYAEVRGKLLKPLVLAIIYGQTVDSTARSTGQRRSFIKVIFLRLRRSYPKLFEFVKGQVAAGFSRGYVEVFSGFRIHTSGSSRERNFLMNYPVQATCAVLFNRALLECYKLADYHGARILLPLYDSIVVEAPLEALEKCAALFSEVFAATFQSLFPSAKAKVKIDVDLEHPECWSHDGYEGEDAPEENLNSSPGQEDGDEGT